MSNTVGKLIEELLEVFKKNYKRPRLWICLGLIIFCFVLLFPYIDSNFLYFSRMEKRISILERVMELDQEKINSNQAYQNEYQSILKEMEQQSERTINSVMNRVSNYINNLMETGKEQGNRWVKFFTGAIWFIIVTVCIPFMNTFKKRSDKVLAFVLMIIISFLAGWIFSIIPIIVTPMFNYIGIPIMQIILLIAIVNKSKKN
ncbi:MAG: hypothetical protein IKL49_00865 [Lachnospiraceae bacterium]|nr:hypothetical protein [Lachnospiraceae bacterium]